MVEISEYEYRSGFKIVIINLDGLFILTVFTKHNNRCYGKTAKYLAIEFVSYSENIIILTSFWCLLFRTMYSLIIVKQKKFLLLNT